MMFSPHPAVPRPNGGSDVHSPPGCPCDRPTGGGDIQSPPGVSADWCPSAPDTIPGPVHPARPVCPDTGPCPSGHALLPGDTGPWPSGHARSPRYRLNFGFEAVPLRCLICPHDGPGHWAGCFFERLKRSVPTQLISDQPTGGGDEQFPPGCFFNRIGRMVFVTFSPHPAISPIGRLVAVTFSPHPAVPAICRLLVAVTFSPHQVFRPTGTRRPQIQYRALSIQRRPSARLLGPGQSTTPVCPDTGPWPSGHPAMPSAWILGPGYPATADCPWFLIHGHPATLLLVP
jgi:hypothetical protein